MKMNVFQFGMILGSIWQLSDDQTKMVVGSVIMICCAIGLMIDLFISRD